MKDRFTASGNDLSYYPLLFLALEETKEGDVIEMGTGHGSTLLLHDYCKNNNRWLFSYDEKQVWLDKFLHLKDVGHTLRLVNDWDIVKETHMSKEEEQPSVVFIDHAPGERRKEDIVHFKDVKGILVIHDTEPTGAGDYQMRQHWGKFKYIVEVKTDGAWASALSNHIDITKWKGIWGNYTIS